MSHSTAVLKPIKMHPWVRHAQPVSSALCQWGPGLK